LTETKAHESALRGPEVSEFKRKSVRGGVLTVFNQSFGMATQLGTAIILARLLTPSDYGLQSMVFTLTTVLALFKDAGLSAASIQRQDLTREQISTLFWVNVALGSLLTLVVAAAAPFLATFYKEPRLLWITVASAPIFFLSSLVVQHSALLARAMRFGTTIKINMFSATAGAILAIVMAAKGFGYWALICQNISLPLFEMIAIWIAIPWIPGRPRWSPELRSMLRFGGTLTMNGIVVYVAYNTEKILLGRFWGAAPLGIYTRGYQLATLPVQQLIGAVHVVAFSVLSRMQGESEKLERAYLKSLSIIVAMTVPVVICSTLFANEIILIVLGPKWLAAAPVLRLLSPTVLVFALINPFSWLLKSTGRVRRSLNIAFLICPVVVLGVVAGLHNGPAGVALGYSGAMLLLLVPVVMWAKHGTGITSRNYWDAVKQPLISGVIAGGAGWLAHMKYGNTLSPIPLLSVELGVSALVYFGWILFVMGQKDFYFDLVKTIVQSRRVVPAESVT
jgi:O-antigen/teichoic acid export membrane protein